MSRPMMSALSCTTAVDSDPGCRRAGGYPLQMRPIVIEDVIVFKPLHQHIGQASGSLGRFRVAAFSEIVPDSLAWNAAHFLEFRRSRCPIQLCGTSPKQLDDLVTRPTSG